MLLQQCPYLAHHVEVRHELGLQFRQSIGSEVRRSHDEKDVYFRRNGKWKAIPAIRLKYRISNKKRRMMKAWATIPLMRWLIISPLFQDGLREAENLTQRREGAKFPKPSDLCAFA
jgi:hypothetical protein